MEVVKNKTQKKTISFIKKLLIAVWMISMLAVGIVMLLEDKYNIKRDLFDKNGQFKNIDQTVKKIHESFEGTVLEILPDFKEFVGNIFHTYYHIKIDDEYIKYDFTIKFSDNQMRPPFHNLQVVFLSGVTMKVSEVDFSQMSLHMQSIMKWYKQEFSDTEELDKFYEKMVQEIINYTRSKRYLVIKENKIPFQEEMFPEIFIQSDDKHYTIQMSLVKEESSDDIVYALQLLRLYNKE